MLLAANLGLLASLGYLANELRLEKAESRRESEMRRSLEARLAEPARSRQKAAQDDRAQEPRAQAAAQGGARTILAGFSDEDISRECDRRQKLHRRERLDRMLSDPSARAFYLARRKAVIRLDKLDLAAAIGLTPEQEDAFFALLAEHELQKEDFSNREHVRNPGASTDLSALARQQQREIHELFGPQLYERYFEYLASAAERAQVAALEKRLTEAQALSREQAQQLMAVVREERNLHVARLSENGITSYMAEYPYVPSGRGLGSAAPALHAEEQTDFTEDFLRRVVKRAESILTPEQLEQFERLQAHELDRVKLYIEQLRRWANESRGR